MNGRMILGAVIAAVVLMAWGFAFWTGLGSVVKPVAELPNDDAFRALLKTVPATGVYWVPAGTMSDDEAVRTAAAEKHADGPLATIFVRSTGAPLMSPMVFVKGFLHYAALALLVGVILRKVPTTGGLGFVALIAILAPLAINVAHPIWFYHPWRFWLLVSVYDAVMIFLAGLVMRKFAIS